MRQIVTNSPEETIRLGADLARKLKKGDLLALEGELGTGKTMFVKGLAKGLGVKDYMHVDSPSFVIVKEYCGRKKLYHFDAYRLNEKAFCETLDYKRYFYDDGITVVEWADRIKNILPENYLEITIEHAGQTKRRFIIQTVGTGVLL